jgi:hypothetical protein
MPDAAHANGEKNQPVWSSPTRERLRRKKAKKKSLVYSLVSFCVFASWRLCVEICLFAQSPGSGLVTLKGVAPQHHGCASTHKPTACSRIIKDAPRGAPPRGSLREALTMRGSRRRWCLWRGRGTVEVRSPRCGSGSGPCYGPSLRINYNDFAGPSFAEERFFCVSASWRLCVEIRISVQIRAWLPARRASGRCSFCDLERGGPHPWLILG